MSQSLKIAKLGESILRQVATPIDNFQDDQLQSLIDNLLLTCEESEGVGIAAPQVSQSLRLFIVASRPNSRYPHAPVMSPTAMINPKIIAHNQEKVKGWEGCLSVPNQRGLIPRYTEITVQYCDRSGHPQQQVLTDFVARIFQHELDHLDGLVFLDRLASEADFYTEEEYQEIMNYEL